MISKDFRTGTAFHVIGTARLVGEPVKTRRPVKRCVRCGIDRRVHESRKTAALCLDCKRYCFSAGELHLWEAS